MYTHMHTCMHAYKVSEMTQWDKGALENADTWACILFSHRHCWWFSSPSQCNINANQCTHWSVSFAENNAHRFSSSSPHTGTMQISVDRERGIYNNGHMPQWGLDRTDLIINMKWTGTNSEWTRTKFMVAILRLLGCQQLMPAIRDCSNLMAEEG